MNAGIMPRACIGVALAVLSAAAQVPIGDLHRNDAQGYPLPPYGIGAEVQIAGVVTVPTGTFSSIRTEIYVQDDTGGIVAYRSDHIYPVALGDSVRVVGTIQQYRGTTQILPSSVEVLASGASVPAPDVRTCATIAQCFQPDHSEPDESRLVEVRFASYDASTGTISDATGSCVLYVDFDTGIQLTTGTYHIAGIVKQWDETLPYTDSYQLLPRFQSDIGEVEGPRFIDGPIEGDFTPDGFTVRWSTDTPAAGRLLWGTLIPGDTGFADDSLEATSHLIVVGGLQPATIYRLQAVAWNGTGENRSPVWVASTASAPGCTGTITAFFNQSVETAYATQDAANGNALLQRRLLDRINGASHSIDACLFNLTVPEITTALISAFNRGVRVRVVTESENIGTEINRLIAAGIPVLDDTAGPNTGSGYMHDKFLVFDFADASSASDDFVWTGSANITYNGFYENAENVVLIQDQALAGAYTVEFEEMWGSTGPLPDPQASRFGARKVDATPHRFQIGATPVEVYMSPGEGCTAHLLAAIASAQRGAYFSIFGFTNADVEAGLRQARDRGARIAGVFDAAQASGSSEYWPMSGQGPGAWDPPADVHLLSGYPSMHHKYLLVDADNVALDASVVTGSFNWSWSAESANDENLLVIHDSRTANHFLQEFMARYHEAGGVDSLALGTHPAPQRCLDLVVGPCPWRGATALVVRGSGITSVALHDLGGRLVQRVVSPVGLDALHLRASGLAPGLYLLTVSGRGGIESVPAVYLGR